MAAIPVDIGGASRVASIYIQNEFDSWRLQRSSAVKPGTLLQLTNCTIEDDGTIRSRAGSQQIHGASIGTNVHSTFMKYPSLRYYGVDGTIKRAAAGGNILANTLNGSRLTFAEMATSPAFTQNTQWVFFANGQKEACAKDDGTNPPLNWGLDGPTTVPTVALAANYPTNKSIEALDSGWAVASGDAVTVGTDATVKYAGAASTKVTAAATVSGRIQKSFTAVDCTAISGAASPDRDFIRFMIYVDKRERLADVELTLNVGSSTFVDDYYHTQIDLTAITADQTWVEITIPKYAFERVSPTGGATTTWSTVNGAQFTVAANERGAVNVWFDDLRLQSDTHLEGKYTYKVTFKNIKTGQRSKSIDLTTFISSNGLTIRKTAEIQPRRQGVALSSIPTCPANGVSGQPNATTPNTDLVREIWRTTAGQDGIWLLVPPTLTTTGPTIPNNTATTFTDTAPDYLLGEALTDDDDIPPIGTGVGGPWYNRFWTWGMNNGLGTALGVNTGENEMGHVVRYSKALYPESFPQFNYVTVSSPDDPVQTCVFWNGTVYAFTRLRVYKIVGANVVSESDTGAFVAQATDASIGTIFPYSVSVSPYGIFYLSVDGIYLFDGVRSRKITAPAVEALFEGVTFNLEGVNWTPINNKFAGTEGFTASDFSGAYWNNHYYIAYYDRGFIQSVVVFDVIKQRFEHRYYQPAFNILRLTSEGDNLIAGCNNGFAILIDGLAAVNTPFTQDAPFKDNVNSGGGGGSTFVCIVQTKALGAELKDESLETDFKDAIIDIDSRGDAMTVQAIIDGGGAGTLTSTATALGRKRLILPINSGLGTIGYTLGIRLTFTPVTGRWTIYGIGTQHIPEPRRLASFATDYDQCGWPGEKIGQELHLEANTFGNNVTVTAELDGVDLAQTFTLNTSVRKFTVFSFHVAASGAVHEPRFTNIRLKLVDTVTGATFKLYTWRVQKLNEPLTVSRIATEKSDEGWDGEKLFKELAIEIDPMGTAVTLELFLTDGSVGSVTIPGGLARQIFYFSVSDFSANTRSQLEWRGTTWYAELSSAATFRLYSVFMQHEKEPVRNTFWKTPISEDEWIGEKLYRTVEVDLDTRGQPVTIQLYTDGVVQAPSPGSTNVVTTAARRMVYISYPNVRGRLSSITISANTATQFAYYGHQWDLLKEPVVSTRFITEITDDDFAGEKIYKNLTLEADPMGDGVTPTTIAVLVDGTPIVTLLIPAADTGRKIYYFSLADAVAADLERRGRTCNIDIAKTAGTFRYYRHWFPDTEQEPIRNTFWKTPISEDDWIGEKLYRTLELDLDNHNQQVTVQLFVDGVIQTPSPGSTNVIAAQDGRRMYYISYPNVRGRLSSITIDTAGGSIQFAYYSHRWDLLKEPVVSTRFITEKGDDDWPGEKLYKNLTLEIDPMGDGLTATTIQVLLDGAPITTLTIAAGETGRHIYMFSLADNAAAHLERRGRICNIDIAKTAGTFRYYRHWFPDTEKEPVRQSFWKTPVSEDGWLGEKLYRTLELDLDNHNQQVTVQLFVDGVIQAPSPDSTNVIAAQDGRRMYYISYPNVRGRLSSITIDVSPGVAQTQDPTPQFAYYGHQWDLLKEPVVSTRFITELEDADWDGEKIYKNLVLEIDPMGSPASITVFISTPETGAFYAVGPLLTNSQASRQIIYFSLASDDRLEQRGRIAFIDIAKTSGTFRYYRHWFEKENEPIRNTFWKTPISDDEWPAEKSFRTLVVDINTYGAEVIATPYIDGVPITTLNDQVFSTTKRTQIHISMPLPRVRGRNSSITLKSLNGVTQFSFYSHYFDFEKEPLTSLRYFTQWNAYKYEGPKILRQVLLEIDTGGQNVTLNVYGDGTLKDAFLVNTTGRQSLIFSFHASPEAKLISVELVAFGTTRFRYYPDLEFDFVRQPNDVTFWDTVARDAFGGQTGWLRKGFFAYKATVTVTGRIYFDGALRHTFTLPPQTSLQVVRVSFPTGLRGKVPRLTLETNGGTVRPYPETVIWQKRLGEDGFERWDAIQQSVAIQEGVA